MMFFINYPSATVPSKPMLQYSYVVCPLLWEDKQLQEQTCLSHQDNFRHLFWQRESAKPQDGGPILHVHNNNN